MARVLLFSLLIIFSAIFSFSHGADTPGSCSVTHSTNRLAEGLSAITSHACRLEVGESRVIDFPANESLTGVDQTYRLTRVAADTYRAELRLTFISQRSLAPGESKQSEDSRFQSETERCLREIEPRLIGPNGEKLQIRLSSDGEVPLTQIQITEPNTRANDRAYPRNIQCPTMIHEIFHLLGLCDEYQEHRIGLTVDRASGKIIQFDSRQPIENAAYDCRSIGPRDSIMNGEFDATQAVQANDIYEYTFCRCSEKSEACQARVQLIETQQNFPNTCPNGFQQNTKELRSPVSPETGESSIPDIPRSEDTFSLDRTPRRIRREPPRRNSLLYPAQFRFITNPTCFAQNQTFIECARNAYRTSQERNGQGCSNAPPACRNGGHEWLD